MQKVVAFIDIKIPDIGKQTRMLLLLLLLAVGAVDVATGADDDFLFSRVRHHHHHHHRPHQPSPSNAKCVAFLSTVFVRMAMLAVGRCLCALLLLFQTVDVFRKYAL